jgi:hypothetical protein
MESVAIITTLISVGGAFLAQAQVDYFREENRRLAAERRQLQEDLQEERERVGRRDAELEDLDAALDARDEEVKQLQEMAAEEKRKRLEAEQVNGDIALGGGCLLLFILMALMVWAFMLGNSPLLAKCPGPAPYPLL